MSGTVLAQTVARLDHATFKSISVPATAEGRLYFNGTYLRLRSGGTWKTIPGGGGTAGLCDNNPQDIGGTALPGSSSEASRCDHVHRGIASFRKAGDALLYGGVTISPGASIGLTQVGQNVAIAYTGGAGAGEPHQQEDYLIFDDAGTIKARNGDDGNIDFSGGVAETVLESCIAALPSSGGLILIKDFISFDDGDGVVTITKRNVSIKYSGGAYNHNDLLPHIERLVLDSVSRDITGCVFEGLHFNEICLDSSDDLHRIRFNRWLHCRVTATSTVGKQGIIINGGPNTISSIDWCWFDDCYFAQTGCAANMGFVTHQAGNATILIFSGCYTWLSSGGAFLAQKGGTIELIQFVGGTIQVSTLDYVFLDQQDGDLNVDAKTFFEVGSLTLTLLKVTASAEHTFVDIHDSQARLQTGSILELCDIGAALSFARPSVFQFHHNRLNITGTGNWSLGTPSIQNNWEVIIEDNHEINPIGVVANPFDNVLHDIELDGAAASPTVANQDYVVRNTEIIFNSTGGTAVNITIQDPASTIMYTPGATATYVRVPRGFIVNFGNFSAAPTVAIWFI